MHTDSAKILGGVGGSKGGGGNSILIRGIGKTNSKRRKGEAPPAPLKNPAVLLIP